MNSVLELLALQAPPAPERIAVVDKHRELSYAELFRSSELLAKRLQKFSLAPGSHIALALPRSSEYLIALLGLWKAGFVAVPIDSRHPDERQRFILDDANIALLITQKELSGNIPSVSNTVLLSELLLHSSSESIRSSLDTPSQGDGERVAYILYTSGSTGKPKGVCVSHRALLNFLSSMQKTPGFREDDILCAITTFTFDISLLELLLPISVGGKVVIASEDEVLNPKELITLITREKVSYLQATPSYWRTLFRSGFSREHAPQLTALCGGEALTGELLNSFCRSFDGVWNMYGPTETTVWSTCAFLCDPKSPIHVGKAIGNTSIHILNEKQEKVATGSVGKIFIGGQGVAQGYWQRPELTAARFLPNHFAFEDNFSHDSLLYDTGDLGRMDGSGNLFHLGRTDDQVKIRGFRVELGEIEHALLSLDGVDEAGVTLHRRDGNSESLLAFFVGTLHPDDVKASLERLLPAYMVPQLFFRLSDLPRTATGKLDRNALPLPTPAVQEAENETPIEDPLLHDLSKLWSSVLHVGQIQKGNTFFSLGGTSLLALELLSRLEAQIGVSIRYSEFISAKSFQDFVELVRVTPRSEKDGPGVDEKHWGGPKLLQRSPLTRHQSAMLYLEELVPGTAVYNLPFAIELFGTLDEDAFRFALSHTLLSYPGLRIQIQEENGMLIQVVTEDKHPHLQVHQTNLPKDELLLSCGTISEKPFEIRNSPLYRFDLFLTDDGKQLFLATFHHLIFDGWSWTLFLEHLLQAYEAKLASRPLPQTQNTRTTLDLSELQKHSLNKEKVENIRNFWGPRLEGSPHLIELPNELPRPEIFDFRGKRTAVQISEADLNRASERALQLGTSLPSLFLAAFHLTLSALGRSNAPSIALPMRVVPNPAFHNALGCFINALPVRFSTQGEDSLETVVKKAHGELAEVLSERNTPFETVLENLHIPHPSQYPPIAQAFLTFEDLRQRTLSSDSLEVREEFVFPNSCESELNLWMRWLPEGLVSALDYSSSLFLPEQAETIAETFSLILRQILKDSSTRVKDLLLLDEGSESLIHTWGRGPQRSIPRQSIPELLFAEIEEKSKKVAVLTREEEQTYEELFTLSQRIAGRLSHLPPGSPIAVSLKRDIFLPATLLGILHAGHFYMPIDPSYPRERAEVMIHDARPAALIVSSAYAANWEETEAELLVQEDLLQETILNKAPPQLSPEAPAYLLYTSGSTGKPKGVLVPHHSVINFLQSMQARPGFTEQGRMLALTNITFDISVLELYLPLLSGGVVVVASEDETKEPALLLNLIRERSVDCVQATPSTWHLLLKGGLKEVTRPIQKLVGGESLSEELKSLLLGLPGSLWNMYGPTETTVWSTCGEMNEEIVHLGRSIDNTFVEIADQFLRPLPAGFPGELLISGDGLALGYLNRDTLNAERFPEVSRQTSRYRAYRTGDLARFSRHGRLEHLGRIDFQVKIRGHRIELGEIESVLERLPQVAQTLCLVHDFGSDDKRLLLYYTLEGGKALTQSEVRDQLRKSLPAFMIPQHLIELQSFPLNSSRKVDRKALPLPKEFTIRKVKSLPQTPNEIYLASLWSNLLRAQSLSKEDNFFELGGHSLLSLELIGLILNDRGVRLSPRVFLTNSLEQVAKLLPEVAKEEPKSPNSSEKDSERGILGKLKNLRNLFS